MALGTSTESRGEGRSTGRPPLTVERTPTGYVLRDPLLVRLAGIEAVPLPFTARARPAVVLAHLRALSPHREVRFEHPPHPPCA
ncbi:hypothetical protein [Rubrivirga marina]|uniref:Uncharacterized protein n=1 Tax=Rubrivirga marina TaxID=1196024 RepID=A0A271IUH4_9BACT|nr:hypothetical protein [Rubrivirga marina]PAP74219.1 hypothetical protein BSZ37_21395 [Rubrivirga marina]